MNTIQVLEMMEWRTSALDGTGAQIVVKYELVSSETFKCRIFVAQLCNLSRIISNLRIIFFAIFTIGGPINFPFFTATPAPANTASSDN